MQFNTFNELYTLCSQPNELVENKGKRFNENHLKTIEIYLMIEVDNKKIDSNFKNKKAVHLNEPTIHNTDEEKNIHNNDNQKVIHTENRRSNFSFDEISNLFIQKTDKYIELRRSQIENLFSMLNDRKIIFNS